jgi:hypothetical protein
LRKTNCFVAELSQNRASGKEDGGTRRRIKLRRSKAAPSRRISKESPARMTLSRRFLTRASLVHEYQ